MVEKNLYLFGVGHGADGDATMVDILGGKGANLAEMAKLEIPVPPGFTIPTARCKEYHESKYQQIMIDVLLEEVMGKLGALEHHFGYMPLVSVRSGAPVSMPGMMDTILNVGLTESNYDEWVNRLGGRTTLDCERRLLQMYGTTVYGIPAELFEKALKTIKVIKKVKDDSELAKEALLLVVEEFVTIFEKYHVCLPDTLEEQLEGAIKAVFDSWMSERAIYYRKIEGIPDDLFTAVNIQSMVFGNMNDESCSGVMFTRCPSTGLDGSVGEFLINAQGEDVVAGVRTPSPLWSIDDKDLNDWNSELSSELVSTANQLEAHYKDMQDIEFTVQSGKLYILQTRNGKRTSKAAFRIAKDMLDDEVITKKELKERLAVEDYLALKENSIDPVFTDGCDAKGIPAGGGIVKGRASFSSDEAVVASEDGPVILIAKETTPDDIKGMHASVGILTSTGGATSHAAVVARGMNKSCVVGCQDLKFNGSFAILEGVQIKEGTWVTIDGHTGRIWLENVPLIEGEENKDAEGILSVLIQNHDELILRDKIEGGTQLYLDTCWIDGDASKLTTILSECIMDKYDHVVLDLKTRLCYMNDEDVEALIFIGHTKETLLQARIDIVQGKIDELIKWEKHQGIQIVYPEGLSEEMFVGIKELYPPAGKAETMKDLLAGGMVDVSEEFIKKVIGGKAAFNKLKKMLKDSGIKLSPMAQPVSKEKAMHLILSK